MKNNFNLIERFFSGVMNQTEIDEFEARKLADVDFANEVALYQTANEVIKAGARHRMKQYLNDLGEKEIPAARIEPFEQYGLIRKYWAIAASIVVILGISYFAYHSIQSQRPMPTMAQIFTSYYDTPDADMVISRGTNGDSLSELTWNLALQKYGNLQYQDALNDMNRLLADSSFNLQSSAHFYAGICYLLLNKADSAIIHLNKVSTSSSLIQDATWYLGLSYLKASDFVKAAKVFDDISKSGNHFKKEEAKDISQTLSGMKR